MKTQTNDDDEAMAEHEAILREHVYQTVHGLEVRLARAERSDASETAKKKDAQDEQPAYQFDFEHGVVDSVDEANAESFPASDSPATW